MKKKTEKKTFSFGNSQLTIKFMPRSKSLHVISCFVWVCVCVGVYYICS